MAAKREVSRSAADSCRPIYGLVPLHGLHVAAGCIWLIVLGIQLRVMGMTDLVKSRVVRLALFWHFLDLIWIGIITIVYFGGLAYE